MTPPIVTVLDLTIKRIAFNNGCWSSNPFKYDVYPSQDRLQISKWMKVIGGAVNRLNYAEHHKFTAMTKAALTGKIRRADNNGYRASCDVISLLLVKIHERRYRWRGWRDYNRYWQLKSPRCRQKTFISTVSPTIFKPNDLGVHDCVNGFLVVSLTPRSTPCFRVLAAMLGKGTLQSPVPYRMRT